MNLSEEQLSEIENMAGLFFSIEDIGINIDLPLHEVEELREIVEKDTSNVIYRRYHKGRLTNEVKLRTAINQSALNGSNPAQNTMLNFRQQNL